MKTNRLPWAIVEPPPANLADLVVLHYQALPDGALTPAWRRLREALTRLLVRVEAHVCGGPRCPKCAEYYALVQLLAHRQRQLSRDRHGEAHQQ
jgi:hypothetical protein